MKKSQLDAAWGKVFEAPGVINGSARVRFMGVWPSGNVAVKRGGDPDGFGPLTVTGNATGRLVRAQDGTER